MTSTLASLVESIGSSLHAYLAAARVWTFPGGESLKLALVDLAADERAIADSARRLLEERGEEVPRPTFPIAFTGLHDADLDALLPRVLDGLRRQVVTFDHLIDLEAGADQASLDLVRQAREAAIQHGDVLEEIAKRRPVPESPNAAG